MAKCPNCGKDADKPIWTVDASSFYLEAYLCDESYMRFHVSKGE